MMGVPIDGASRIFGDNIKPESTLKKKSNSFCYHAVSEAVVMGEALVAHIGMAPLILVTLLTFSPMPCMIKPAGSLWVG
ncbi:hypothetical protein ACHAXN_004573 [Cyclotella atomus]